MKKIYHFIGESISKYELFTRRSAYERYLNRENIDHERIV